jgi:stage II sporulation protein R
MARTHQRALAGAADATLARLGLPYRAQVKVGWQPMPPKVWGSVALPAGTYPTVTVLLGRAQGQNWWCVVFPPLCLLDPAYAVSQSVPPSAPLAGPVRLQGRPQETSWWGRVLNWLRALGV